MANTNLENKIKEYAKTWYKQGSYIHSICFTLNGMYKDYIPEDRIEYLVVKAIQEL